MPPTWTEKPLLKSRTIITIIGTIAGFLLMQFLGVDVRPLIGDIGADHVVTIGEAWLLAGAVIAGWFRAKATGPIAGVVTTPEG